MIPLKYLFAILASMASVLPAAGKLKDLMSQGNHPNRKGHDLVVEKLTEWFPKK